MSPIKPLLTTAEGGPTARSAGRAWLVTGCAGFIGSHLSETLLDRGDQVVGIDAFTDYYARQIKEANLSRLRDRGRFTFVEADLISAPLASLVEGTDGVFHLAGQPGVSSFGDVFPVYVRQNLVATQRLLEAAVSSPTRVTMAAFSPSRDAPTAVFAGEPPRYLANDRMSSSRPPTCSP